MRPWVIPTWVSPRGRLVDEWKRQRAGGAEHLGGAACAGPLGDHVISISDEEEVHPLGKAELQAHGTLVSRLLEEARRIQGSCTSSLSVRSPSRDPESEAEAVAEDSASETGAVAEDSESEAEAAAEDSVLESEAEVAAEDPYNLEAESVCGED